VILTDSLGVPLFVNRAAELMMAQRDISLSQGRLALLTSPETALLHRLIAGAAQGAAIGGDMRITLPGRFEFLQCLVTPVSPEFSARLGISLGSGRAAIFLSKPGSLQLPPKRLAILYGLTPAESRLAAKLAAFSSLGDAANDLGIATGTARTQLAAVFAKTGAKTQGELLMLLATGTLAHCRDD
jgi:DNA-binding CsgD family transcriptional regulator